MSDQGTQGLLSPWLRSRRLAVALPHVHGKVLDYGCGAGALAGFIHPADYLGFDIDPVSIATAHEKHPNHMFTTTVPPGQEFDTVVSLAVIEHMKDPLDFLSQLASFCKDGGRIVISTPHPALDPVHHLGAKMGLFSHDASEEHVSLLNRRALLDLAARLKLRVVIYTRFLFGANQLLALQK